MMEVMKRLNTRMSIPQHKKQRRDRTTSVVAPCGGEGLPFPPDNVEVQRAPGPPGPQVEGAPLRRYTT